MLKCTLRSPKTINGGIGEKKNVFSEKKNFLRIFFTKRFVPLVCQSIGDV